MATGQPIRQESVWDYPRPPGLEPSSRLWVVHGGMVLAQTCRGLRILETSHPPVYYFPLRCHDAVDAGRLRPKNLLRVQRCGQLLGPHSWVGRGDP